MARTISASPTDADAAAGTIALADRVYAELVRGLYASPLQAVYMAFIFTGYLALVLHAAPDAAILILGLLALAAWATRILTTVRLQRKALTAQLDRQAAKRLEMLFAVPYGSFAALLGMIGARVFHLDNGDARVLTICVLVGFCAGIATGVGSRPRLATLFMALTMAPTLVFALAEARPLTIGLAFIAMAYVVGAPIAADAP
ncbi:hypothetical protein ACFS32_13510 [Novosphingobium pokkalii]|uniref:hypothetical protein n=1 Tax=Novosphingobium pokkalii TaxID=1770194 RepID=UPI00363FF7CB